MVWAVFIALLFLIALTGGDKENMTQSLINDPAVAKYRQLEIEEGAKIAEELLKDGLNVDFVRGAMCMLKKLLQLPHRWGTSKEAKEASQMMIKRDLKTFTTKYMKLFVE